MGCIVGCRVGCFVGCPVGCLDGCLVGCPEGAETHVYITFFQFVDRVDLVTRFDVVPAIEPPPPLTPTLPGLRSCHDILLAIVTAPVHDSLEMSVKASAAEDSLVKPMELPATQ